MKHFATVAKFKYLGKIATKLTKLQSHSR